MLIGQREVTGAMTGGDDWLKHLKGVQASMGVSAPERVAFRRVKSLAELETAVAQASQAGQPAMLDFYADWCVECLRMERNTFVAPAVQALFQQLQPLQADVTANDAIDKELLSKYGIIGPPAILFFDRHGKELRNYRLVGYFEPKTFAYHLGKILDTP